ncbi:MAG: nucleotidyltransferase family protein [Desulfurococcaceae archaeon]
MLTKTLKLVESINSGSIANDNMEDLIELAKLNKVLLGFLRRVGYEGYLRSAEEALYKQYMSEVAKVARALQGLNYALYKFRKPVEHVSVDIDILIHNKHLREAVRRLKKDGFRVEILEPYTVTMVKGRIIVDLYTHPSFAWIIYLDGERLLEEVETIEIGPVDVEVRVLSREAEAVATVAHAVYKEHVYLLSDYYVVREWFNRRALNLARELRAEDAVEVALLVNERIEKGLLETPVKLTLAQLAVVLAKKFMEDPVFRATTVNIPRLAVRRRTVQQLFWRIKRKTY